MIPPYFLIFLFPLGIYLLILANINRRDKPLMIGGSWDAILLSFGLSGVLLWVGPAILGVFYERGLLPGSADLPNRQFNQVWELYPFIWISYYLLVLCGQILMIISRRDKTVIYNVDVSALEQLVGRVLGEKGYRVSLGNGLIVFEKPRTENDSGRASERGAVDIESFSSMRHATLHWHTHDYRLRLAVEHDVAIELPDAATTENPSVSWLLGVSGMIFGFVILGAVFLILAKLMPGRWS